MKKLKARGAGKIKKKTKKLVTSSLILIGVFVVILLVRIFSGEDTWVCKDGEWQKHGKPSTPQPTTLCR